MSKPPRFLAAVIVLLAFMNTVIGQEEQVVIDDRYRVRADVLEVDLNVDGGEVRLSRNDDAETVEVYLEYSRDKCRGDVRFFEEESRLEIEIDLNNLKFWDKKAGEKNVVHAIVDVKLPYGPEIDLHVGVKAGEIDMSLGDLAMKRFELSNWAGEVRVDFDAPNRISMETFDVNHRVGECKLSNIGNARFEQADINGGIGELTIDFRGQGVERCMARIDLDIGETRIIIPEEIGTKLKVSKFLFLSNIEYPDWFEKEGRYYYSRNYRQDDRSLYLMISAGIGELGIEVQ